MRLSDFMPDALSDSVEVIVSGHLCMDLIPAMSRVTLQQLATPGRLWETGPMGISTGGAVSNTGIALHRLGVNVRLMATVGDDLLGQAIIAYLNSQDPTLGQYISVQAKQPTSYSVVLSPEASDRTFLHCTGTNSTFGIDNINYDLVAGAKIFHLGYPPLLPRLIANDGAQMREMCQRAKAVGVVTSIDTVMTDPEGATKHVNWRAVWVNTLPHIDIFLPSVEELVMMLRRSDYDAWNGKVLPHLTGAYLHELAGELLGMGAAIAGFKLGEMGLYLRTADAARLDSLKKLGLVPAAWANVELWTPAYQVTVAGTTGAGDSAFAGFLAALLHGLPPLDAMRWACAVGACNVEAVDSTSGVRSWEETRARLESVWPTRPERPAGVQSLDG